MQSMSVILMMGLGLIAVQINGLWTLFGFLVLANTLAIFNEDKFIEPKGRVLRLKFFKISCWKTLKNKKYNDL